MATEDSVLSIRDLAKTVEAADIKAFFKKDNANSNPKVHLLTTCGNTELRGTTVIFSHPQGEQARRDVVKRLSEAPFEDRTGSLSEHVVSLEFLGLTVLAQSRGDPMFDICFVHGLDGHAYRTFDSDPKRPRESCLWPRDILPEVLERAGYLGRYLTWGYEASPFRGKFSPKLVQETAERLLNDIESSRPRGCKRPIFFVCHSLGGLIVCQALVAIMQGQTAGDTPRDFHDIFTSPEGCLVPGIVFFGTPFKGSIFATLADPVSRALRFNRSFLRNLKLRNPRIKAMIHEFDDLRMQSQYAIPIRIFYEKRPMAASFLPLIVSDESAKGYFRDNVRRYAIEKDHQSICRFASSKDQDFETIAKVLRELIAAATKDRLAISLIPQRDINDEQLAQRLQLPSMTATHVPNPGPLISTRWRETNAIDLLDPLILNSPASGSDSHRIAALRLRLGLHGMPFSQEIPSALPDTCDWIRGKQIYTAWRDHEKDSILFIRSGQGTGKSVLTKYIVEDVRSTSDSSSTIIHIPCKGLGKRDSPRLFLLRHILYRLSESLSDHMAAFLMERGTLLGERCNFTFYWEMFQFLRNNASFKLYCIIDGLDECINDIKEEGSPDLDQNLISFLETLCKTLSGDATTTGSCTKVLLTTRPIREVDTVLPQFSDTVLDILEADSLPGVAKMIDTQMDVLAQAKGLSDELRDMIAESIKEKAGPMYQWAQSTLQMLREHNFVINAKQQYQSLLEKFRLKDIDSTYKESLQNLRMTTFLSNEVKELIAMLIKVVIFAVADLRLEDLQYALMFYHLNSRDPDLRSHLPTSLESVLRSYCGNLLSIEGEDKIVRVAHQSVQSYFLNLPSKEWPDFSCQNFSQCHLLICKMCVKCLLVWHHAEVPGLQNTSDVWERLELQRKIPFVAYSSCCFDRHLRQTKELKAIWPYLTMLFDPADCNFLLSHMIRQYYESDSDTMKTVPPTSVFLAEHDLSEVIKRCYHGRKLKPRKRIRLSPRWPFYRVKLDLTISIDLSDKDQESRTMLHVAAENGNISLVHYLIDNGANGRCKDKDGRTPFHYAMAAEEEKAALALLDRHQAELETADNSRISSLQYAAYFGMIRVIERLIARGDVIDEDHALFSWSALYVACQFNQVAVAELLLEKGANPMRRSTKGRTSLHAAANNDNAELFRLISRYHPDSDFSVVDDDNMTPLLISALNGHHNSYSFLSSKTTHLQPDKDGWMPVHAAAHSGSLNIVETISPSQYQLPDREGDIPLCIAIRKSHEAVVSHLLKHSSTSVHHSRHHPYALKGSSDLESRCVYPITFAASGQNINILDLLLKEGPRLDMRYPNGSNLLHLAASTGSEKVLRRLLEQGVNALGVNNDGRTPLMAAARVGNETNFTVLLQHLQERDEFRPNDIDLSGNTVLHMAVSGGSKLIVNKLLMEGVDPSIRTKRQGTVFMHIGNGSSMDIFDLLVQRDLDPLLPDMCGDTPLSWIASHGAVDVVKLLIAKCTDRRRVVQSRSIIGETPLLYASVNGKVDVVQLFLPRIITADVESLDSSGRCILDFLTEKNPARKLFQTSYDGYSEPDAEARLNHVRACIPGVLHHFQQCGINIDRSMRAGEFIIYAYPFLALGDDNITKVLLECLLTRVRDRARISELDCGGCDRDYSTGAMHICRSCYIHIRCHACYQKFRKDNEDKGYCIAEHEYLEFGGEEWWAREEGVVDDTGRTLEEFMRDLRAAWPLPENETE